MTPACVHSACLKNPAVQSLLLPLRLPLITGPGLSGLGGVGLGIVAIKECTMRVLVGLSSPSRRAPLAALDPRPGPGVVGLEVSDWAGVDSLVAVEVPLSTAASCPVCPRTVVSTSRRGCWRAEGGWYASLEAGMSEASARSASAPTKIESKINRQILVESMLRVCRPLYCPYDPTAREGRPSTDERLYSRNRLATV
jgi:hypothetical protein